MHGSAVHLFIQLLTEVLGSGSEGDATGAPDGAADGPGARPTGAFLAPGLTPAAPHFRAGLLLNRALTGSGQISHDRLVYEWLVVLATKSLVRQ